MRIDSVKNFCVLLFAVLVGIIGGVWIATSDHDDKVRLLLLENANLRISVEAHENYYKATEKLLDSLDEKYYWTDAFDPQDYENAIRDLKAKGVE